ncbi:ATP-binding protein [Chryseobacterium sp. S-02]|uniref:tetratricopeptide repeat-containing sensor histidine kinase n=1 Tax=Chryseobacterium sp. S-02 TaxID=3404064 RepID=UPI003CF4421A
MKKLLFFIFLLLLFSCKKEIKETLDNNYYKKARICRDSKHSDSAFYYYNLAKNEYLKINDSLGVGNSLVNMALIQTDKGDFYGGIESSFEANKFLRRENDSIFRNRLATNYNNIGLAFHFLKDFEKSSFFYIKTLQYIDLTENKLLCYNNIGDVLISQQKYGLAKIYLEKAYLTQNSTTLSKVINNLAKAKYLDNKKYNPLPEFNRALKIREIQKDSIGLNSSYETLSTYYLDKDKNLSLLFAEKMLTKAIKNKSPDDRITALQRIITLDAKNYLNNFQHFNFINDSLQTVRSKAKNQFAVVRYDVEQKNADNLKLKSKSFKQNIALIALGLTIIGGSFYYIKRKKRLEQEKELEVKNTELKISKKVHDVVANGIYQVMTKIENQEHFNKDEALDELEFVYEKSRDISYEKADIQSEEKDFSEKISETVSSFKNDEVNTYLAGNDIDTWKHLSSKNKEEVYQIIRELLINMKKHSRATIVSFRFERENDLIRIFYTDNGIGIPGDLIYKNGLSSTVSRIETINGEIIFDTKTEKGLKITISFPAS